MNHQFIVPESADGDKPRERVTQGAPRSRQQQTGVWAKEIEERLPKHDSDGKMMP
jgi:hypothetical protein